MATTDQWLEGGTGECTECRRYGYCGKKCKNWHKRIRSEMASIVERKTGLISLVAGMNSSHSKL